MVEPRTYDQLRVARRVADRAAQRLALLACKPPRHLLINEPHLVRDLARPKGAL